MDEWVHIFNAYNRYFLKISEKMKFTIQCVYTCNSGGVVTPLPEVWTSVGELGGVGDSPCGNGLKHYFNYKGVTSLHLLVFKVISFCVSVSGWHSLLPRSKSAASLLRAKEVRLILMAFICLFIFLVLFC